MNEYLWRVVFEGQVTFTTYESVYVITSVPLDCSATCTDLSDIDGVLKSFGRQSLQDDCPGPAIIDWESLLRLLIKHGIANRGLAYQRLEKGEKGCREIYKHLDANFLIEGLDITDKVRKELLREIL